MEDPNDVEVLLAGLEVGSISELRRLVTAGRDGVVVTPHQARAIVLMYAAPDADASALRLSVLDDAEPGARSVAVRLRNGRIPGHIHAEALGDGLRSCLFAPDVTRNGGNLGISYESLMSLPE